MGRRRVFGTNAERQRAYRDRRAREIAGLRAAAASPPGNIPEDWRPEGMWWREELETMERAAFRFWAETVKGAEFWQEAPNWDGPSDIDIYRKHFEDWWKEAGPERLAAHFRGNLPGREIKDGAA